MKHHITKQTHHYFRPKHKGSGPTPKRNNINNQEEFSDPSNINISSVVGFFVSLLLIGVLISSC